MIDAVLSLFDWLPPGLRVIVVGVIFVFVLVTVLRLVKLILDVIPFV